MSTKTKRAKLRINTLDLTLAELDRVSKLVEDGRAGRMVAICYVWSKRDRPSCDLAEFANLTMRDVDIYEDDDEAGADPTPAP